MFSTLSWEAKAGGLVARQTQWPWDLCPVVDRCCLLQHRLNRYTPDRAVSTQLLVAVSITAELGLQVWLMNCLVDSHCQTVVVTALNYFLNSLCYSSLEFKDTSGCNLVECIKWKRRRNVKSNPYLSFPNRQSVPILSVFFSHTTGPMFMSVAQEHFTLSVDTLNLELTKR